MGGKLFRKRRWNAWHEQGGLCFWCSGEMLLFDKVPKNFRRHPKLCTLDHIDSRFNPRRGQYPEGTIRRVAACLGCNERRSHVEVEHFNKYGKFG